MFADAGMNLKHIGKFLDHASERTTMKYIKTSNELVKMLCKNVFTITGSGIMKKSDIRTLEQVKKLNGEFVRKLQILMAHRLL